MCAVKTTYSSATKIYLRSVDKEKVYIKIYLEENSMRVTKTFAAQLLKKELNLKTTNE